MTCDTPSIDVSAYPALLAGPIIRRLTRNSVTIWAALSDRDFTNPLNPPTVQVVVQVPNLPGSTTGPPTVVGSSPLVRIGEHVFLAVVTVTLPATTFFENNTLYEYKLEYLGGTPLTGVDRNEIDWSAFSYGTATQPAFVGLCAPGTANPMPLNQFSMYHVSCRKAHGLGRDGLAILDAVLKQDSRPANRPHLLVLTGDQIYADDLADHVLLRVHQVNQDLVNIDESELPSATDSQGRLKLQQRLQIQDDEEWGFTEHPVENQLWFLGEYYAMYLLAWSDVLWRQPDDPSSFIQLPDLDDCEINLPALDDTDEALSKAEDARRIRWDKEAAAVDAFIRALPDVRRALANIPTLMIFDDHEVTDDWNLNFQWASTVYQHSQAVEVIVNALSAYFLFQHWGNIAPTVAARSVESSILTSLVYQPGGTYPFPNNDLTVTTGAGSLAAMATSLGLCVGNVYNNHDWTTIAGQTGPNPFILRPNFGTPADPGIRWDFSITGDYPFTLFLLDGRTTREFRSEYAEGGAISASALDAMLPDPQPAPPAAPINLPGLTVIVWPVPLLAIHVFEHAAQPLMLTFVEDGAARADWETNWAEFANKYQALLRRMASYSPAVVLTGDIHTSYTKKLEFTPNPATAPLFNWNLAQFTSSAAKNPDIKTMALHTLGDFAQQIGLARHRTYWVFNPGRSDVKDTFKRMPLANQAVPWDDLVDLLIGRVYRDALEMDNGHPLVVSQEIGLAYGFTAQDPDATYTAFLIEEEPAAPPVAPQWTGGQTDQWQPDLSAQAVNELRQLGATRTGQVFQSLGQVSEVTFTQGAAGNITAQQVVHQVVGWQEDGVLNLPVPGSTVPGQNVIQITTSVQLF